jgi:hypothetical protein
MYKGRMMTRTFATTCGLLVLGYVAIAAQAGGGWTTVFDGKSLDQFTPVGMANWRIADGTVEATSGMAGFLVTKQSYGDHEIRAEVWTTPDANSGIFVRCQDPNKVGAASCYEVNVYDQRPDQTYRTGGIVDLAKPMAMINAGNQWNTLEITAKGPRLIVRMNGTLMVDVEDRKFARGPFALQAGAGTVRFRNVQVRELK